MYSDNHNGVVKTQQRGGHVTFQRERLQDLWGEVEPLLTAHHGEIASYPDIPLAPDKARYKAVEDAGQFRCYTVRVDGKLAGYAMFFVNRNAHYSTSMQAVQDVVFVAPEHRRGRLGLQLLQYAETALTDEGVDVVHHHVKTAHPALGRLLEHMGYDMTERVYTKRLMRTE